MASVQNSKMGINNYDFDRHKKFLNAITLIGVFAVIIIELKKTNDHVIDAIINDSIESYYDGTLETGSILLIIGILFLVFGALNQFYIENKNIMILSTLALSIPLMLRGLINLLINVS
jgi:hypothetical protein